MDLKEEGLIPVARAEVEGDYYCSICGKLLHLKAGDTVPRCCGKVMELLD